MNMKRSLFAILAAMVPFLLVGVMTVDAATQFNFSGQFRPRYEMWEQDDFSSVTLENHFFHTRVRFNVEAVISENISVFIQFQSNGAWGDDEVYTSSSRDGNRRATVPNQFLADVGFHQAFAIIKNVFAVQGLSTKIGRQELVLDGHRLFGNTLWTQGGQSHDAIRADYQVGNFSLMYFFSKDREEADIAFVGGGDSPSDIRDINHHIVYAALNGVLGGKFSAYFVASDDDSFNRDGTTAEGTYPRDVDYYSNNIYTIGARQAGQLFGIDYRGEFYYQFGSAEGTSMLSLFTTGTGAPSVSSFNEPMDWDRSAYMFGLRIGKKFNNVMWKPSFTIWYDHLSGTDAEDIVTKEWSTFNTLFDTGHKFYGFMDTYLNAAGRDTSYLGLQDLALKTSIKPTSKITIKADLHFFWTETDIDCANDVCAGTDGENELIADFIDGSFSAGGALTEDDWVSYLGHELDLTFVYKYAPSTTFTVGYSHFWADNWFHVVGAASAGSLTKGREFRDGTSPGLGDDASWAYVQMNVNF